MNDTAAVRADLCVIGSGIAALNALVVASGYLERHQRVVLIERRPRSGGMWNEAYPFVRLHQPHGLFTAGAIPWRGGHPRSYLATRTEILGHFTHMLDVVRSRVQLDERYGWEFVEHEEAGGRVSVRARNADGETLEVDCARLIKAFGTEVQPDVALPFTSDRVRSVAPTSLVERMEEVRADDAPIWIVGGGKTAMDTASLLARELPGRELHMIVGAGTFFSNRDRLFPDGARDRWRPQSTPNSLAGQLARRFDGTNEAEVRRWLRGRYGIGLIPEADNYFFGILSEAENETISRALASTVRDYLADVRGTELVLRSGATREVPAGTWIVACTGLITPVDRGYEPYSSASGNVLTISLRSSTVMFSSFMGYFLTHLMYRGRLATAPLYQVDFSELARTAKHASPYVMASIAHYNLGVMSQVLPLRVFLDCGLDFDRWMPIPHRVAANVSFTARRRGDAAHLRTVLDTVSERFDVRCGPLESVSPA